MTGFEVLAVLGLLAGGVALNLIARRWVKVRGTTPQSVNVVAHRRLDAANAVWIIEADGRRMLVGTGRDGPRFLSELPPP